MVVEKEYFLLLAASFGWFLSPVFDLQLSCYILNVKCSIVEVAYPYYYQPFVKLSSFPYQFLSLSPLQQYELGGGVEIT